MTTLAEEVAQATFEQRYRDTGAENIRLAAELGTYKAAYETSERLVQHLRLELFSGLCFEHRPPDPRCHVCSNVIRERMRADCATAERAVLALELNATRSALAAAQGDGKP